jgi:5-methylcytosine-specific restriction enzyme B
VLYGPPGTGKTFLVKRLARALAEEDDDRWAIVQFHPATTYEDFIEGLRPKLVDGAVTYELTPGPLVRIAARAAERPDQNFVLVIDEINRANLPKVLGELLFLLEYRTERVQLLYRGGETFSLPWNLWFIGTMNTADRSIALIDAAMRRRFHFVPFFPHRGEMRDLLRRWLAREGHPASIAAFIDEVNAELCDRLGEHLLLGPSFFMKDDLSPEGLKRIWEHNVFPFLEEQFWGSQTEVDRWRWEAVCERHRGALGIAAPSDAGDAESAAVAAELDAADSGPTAT